MYIYGFFVSQTLRQRGDLGDNSLFPPWKKEKKKKEKPKPTPISSSEITQQSWKE
jgi:hypothetical protein